MYDLEYDLCLLTITISLYNKNSAIEKDPRLFILCIANRKSNIAILPQYLQLLFLYYTNKRIDKKELSIG